MKIEHVWLYGQLCIQIKPQSELEKAQLIGLEKDAINVASGFKKMIKGLAEIISPQQPIDFSELSKPIKPVKGVMKTINKETIDKIVRDAISEVMNNPTHREIDNLKKDEIMNTENIKMATGKEIESPKKITSGFVKLTKLTQKEADEVFEQHKDHFKMMNENPINKINKRDEIEKEMVKMNEFGYIKEQSNSTESDIPKDTTYKPKKKSELIE